MADLLGDLDEVSGYAAPPPSAAPPLDFTVLVSAAASTNTTGGSGTDCRRPSLVYEISVSQPVQSWTVIRDHVDFENVGNTLSTVFPSLPSCPALPTLTDACQPPPSNNTDNEAVVPPTAAQMDEIVKARNAVQEWLMSVLLYPGARESPGIREFLCYGANTMPAYLEGVTWIVFSPIQSEPAVQQQQQEQQLLPAASMGSNPVTRMQSVDEMEMDEMFRYEIATAGADAAYDETAALHDFDDDAADYKATERYRPTEEAVTADDEMEFQHMADEVEMIEDVGSLAQSLGASHLGRSLQLQAEMSHPTKGRDQTSQPSPQGLTVGGAPSGSSGGGGISQAFEAAAAARESLSQSSSGIAGLSDSFHRKKPVSAPRLDSFKMIRVIGKGSFGKVFLVREIQTGDMYALKVLRKDNIIKRNQVEHTRTERNVLGYVRHPFIVGLNMAFQSRDKLYFVLDYCAGGELFFHLSKVGRFPEARAKFYAAEIILAISYVHSLDIIYRDLKPENVLLDAKGHVRLTDFGLSKEGISSSSSGATSFCGTPEYLAPEILNRQGHGRAVDWWSLGALLYEMLTGLPPFYCRDREKLFEKIRKGELEYPRYLAQAAQSLLRGLLTKDPTKRLGSGPEDAEEIKRHPMFKDTDWEKLATGEVEPVWVPEISGSLDTRQFDDEFTKMPMFSPSSVQRQSGFGQTPQDNFFEGFTYVDRSIYDGQRN